jgi:hypothetical protein
VRENRVAQHRVRQPAEHGCLHGCHHFAAFDTQRGESQDAITLRVDQHFQQASRFDKRDGPQYCRHGHFRQAIGDAQLLRFRFVQANPRKFRIGEHTEWYEPVSRRAAAAAQVVADHAEIVVRDVSELRTACTIAHRPNARSCGL